MKQFFKLKVFLSCSQCRFSLFFSGDFDLFSCVLVSLNPTSLKFAVFYKTVTPH